METLDEVALRFAVVLEMHSVLYAIMGGLAVRLYALPRAMFDIDLITLIEQTG